MGGRVKWSFWPQDIIFNLFPLRIVFTRVHRHSRSSRPGTQRSARRRFKLGFGRKFGRKKEEEVVGAISKLKQVKNLRFPSLFRSVSAVMG